MKTIVSHLSPDIDSITSVWLIKRFLPGWAQAELKFVPAGSSLDNQVPDSNPEIIHVDTGLGRFDHHHSSDYISASSLVFDFLKSEGHLREKQAKAMEKMMHEVTGFDHFGEVFFPEPAADHYEFMLHKIIEGGLKSILKEDIRIFEAVFPMLDSILSIFIKKNQAEEEIKKGFVFRTSFGKSLCMETRNEETMKLALKLGFTLVAKKDPERGNIRIKTTPGKKFDLEPLYKKIIKTDKKGTWFLHASHNMLLNSSSKNPNFVASPITLKRLIEIIKSV
jgi:hypothetical protein